MSREHITSYDTRRVRAAVNRIAIRTAVVPSEALTEHLGARVHLKLENLQRTGSFKVRGAAAKLLSLGDEARTRGVVTCSSGNHGRAVAFVAERLRIRATICVPSWVDPVKRDAMTRHGANVVLAGDTYDAAEERAAVIAHEDGLTPVHPFDDPTVIAGQGTIGLELLEQVPAFGTVVVPLSGGGLIAGIAVALKTAHPSIHVVGVSALNARVMLESLEAGHPLSYPEETTVASALSGGIGLDNRHSFALVQEYVDDHVTVTEEEIASAMVFALDRHCLVVEGGGAVAIAALLAGKVPVSDDCVAVVSGGNIATETFIATVQSAV